jgi:hypothetical protein
MGDMGALCVIGACAVESLTAWYSPEPEQRISSLAQPLSRSRRGHVKTAHANVRQ